MISGALNRKTLAYASLVVLAYTFGSFSHHQTPSSELPGSIYSTCSKDQPVDCPTVIPDVHLKGGWSGHPVLSWGPNSVPPETKMLAHKAGFTVFENIYMANKTYFIVTDQPSSFPPVREIINRGLGVDKLGIDHDPTDDDIQVISTETARQLFGVRAIHVQGVSMSTNEAAQYLPHYYHFVGEVLLGLWRLYSTLDMNITPSGETSLEPISRWIFPHVAEGGWRDHAGMNSFLIAAASPSASVWGAEEWSDLADSQFPSIFDKLVVTERVCVERYSDHWKDGKFASVAFRLPASPHWWAPIRRNVLSYVGMNETEIAQQSTKPVITYISRQNSIRRLLEADHNKLVKTLRQLERDHGYEVNIPAMENLPRAEQIRLAARTTILMGVHGNGLTHMLWMHRNPKASVFEFNFPGGYAPDYVWPATAMGFTHYGFWGDKYFTRPNVPGWGQTDGMHGPSIPIDAELVAKLCIDILSK